MSTSRDEILGVASIAVLDVGKTNVRLELLGARGEIVVDGRFARNRLYCRALAALREDQPISRSLDETGTLAGAARLARMPNLGGSPVTERLTPLLQGEICAHRERWRARTNRTM